MNSTTPLPPALADDVVNELLNADLRSAYAAQLQRCPDGWRCLTPREQLYHARLGVPLVYVPIFPHLQLAKEATMPAPGSATEPCFFRTSADRLRAELGPDPVVTDADLDRAMDEAAALTRPGAARHDGRTVAVAAAPPAPRGRALRVISGIIAAACVLGWMLLEVVL